MRNWPRLRWPRHGRAMLLALVAFGALTAPGAAATPERLVLGVAPFREADQMIDNLEPITEALTERLGTQVDGYVSTSYTALVEALGADRVDIAFLGPSALVQAMDRHGARVILASERDGETTYRAQFTVHVDSDLTSFEQLRGRTIAFVDPASASGYQFPYVFLLSRYDIDPEVDMEPIFAGSHDAALLAAYNLDVDVAVSFEDAQDILIDDFPDVNEKLRVLGYTDPIPNDGVVVRRELGDELTAQVKEALLELTATEQGRAMVQDLFRVTGFAQIDEAKYDIVRETMQVFRD